MTFCCTYLPFFHSREKLWLSSTVSWDFRKQLYIQRQSSKGNWIHIPKPFYKVRNKYVCQRTEESIVFRSFVNSVAWELAFGTMTWKGFLSIRSFQKRVLSYGKVLRRLFEGFFPWANRKDLPWVMCSCWEI